MSLLPDSPNMLAFATVDLAVNSLTVLGSGGVNLTPGGGSVTGSAANTITAAATLTASQSGAELTPSALGGTLFTLPAPVVGLRFRLRPQVANTTGSCKVITNVGTVFLMGAISYGIADTTPGANPGPKFTAADGSTHVSIAMNGTTTGGLVGTDVSFLCVSTTKWLVSGNVFASGTITTPFATS